MNRTIKNNLENKEDNYVLPFFWQHGEEEEVLRKYMEAIYNCGIRAVCVESRPHPDFAGPKWWEDMDVILDESKKRKMKVWILDDSHFPTGYANGAMENAPAELCRQSILCQFAEAEGKTEINVEEYLWPKFRKNKMEEAMIKKPAQLREFTDNKFLSITAYQSGIGEPVSLEKYIVGNNLIWDAPAGKWKICFCVLTRNMGPRRNYINMLDKNSCRVLIDEVYEPHYKHYKEDFGTVIAGFFSDEPELGNGHLYPQENLLGTDQDLPWSQEIESELEKRLGAAYKKWMPLLWDKLDVKNKAAAEVRYAYMDAVTRLVEKNFSMQIGNWCREHGVEYIGHIIEDNNQHARTSSSLGHFFRALSGQDMAGIDNIGGQVYPQGEEAEIPGPMAGKRDGEFYHYALGKLGASMGAIDPRKKGRTMCEIFGAYGWSEGVQLEKYLADHFMVRGVNHFVPHAFSGKAYPDADCPPHFYANGNDPQYRHFGALMRYINRICGLISGGWHISNTAILYHGEAEWTGNYMLMQKPAHLLADNQIDYDFIPADVFLEKERYRTKAGSILKIHTQEYKALLIPYAEYISFELAEEVLHLHENGFPVVFLQELPKGIYNGDDSILESLQSCTVVPLEELIEYLKKAGLEEIKLSPENNRMRYLHYRKENDIYYFVNEADETYTGFITVPQTGACYVYNAWDNRIEEIEMLESGKDTTRFQVSLEPRKSLIIIFDEPGIIEKKYTEIPYQTEMEELPFNKNWKRAICRSIDYPDFTKEKEVSLPDRLAEEEPAFSGLVQYKNKFYVKDLSRVILEITDAAEGVEVFINGVSTGIQIVPAYRYDISKFVQEGENDVVIEVANTLEREVFKMCGPTMFSPEEPKSPSGITGQVKIYVSRVPMT